MMYSTLILIRIVDVLWSTKMCKVNEWVYPDAMACRVGTKQKPFKLTNRANKHFYSQGKKALTKQRKGP